MNRKDPAFKDLNGVLQVSCQELCKSGVGAMVKCVVVVIPDEEDTRWVPKVTEDHDPLALQRAVFSYIGKTFFYLRGVEEQSRLKPSQLVCSWFQK